MVAQCGSDLCFSSYGNDGAFDTACGVLWFTEGEHGLVSVCGGQRSTFSVALLPEPEAQIVWLLSAWILLCLPGAGITGTCCYAQLLQGCSRLNLGLYACPANSPQSHFSSSKVACFIILNTSSRPNHLTSLPLFLC